MAKVVALAVLALLVGCDEMRPPLMEERLGEPIPGELLAHLRSRDHIPGFRTYVEADSEVEWVKVAPGDSTIVLLRVPVGKEQEQIDRINVRADQYVSTVLRNTYVF